MFLRMIVAVTYSFVCTLLTDQRFIMETHCTLCEVLWHGAYPGRRAV